jgi:hypothetical protein
MIRRLALISVLVLGFATAAPGQQAKAPARAPVAQDAGPRMTGPLPRYEPSFPSPRTVGEANSNAFDLNDQHTITLSTLGLILVATVLVLLIAL